MKFSIFAAALALAGCAGAMEVESVTTDSVTIRYLEGSKDAADKEAEKQCATFGKRTRFRSTREQGGRSWAIYDCVT